MEETLLQNNNQLGYEKLCLLDNKKYVSGADVGSSNGFDCNICLDSVQDPVVTLCGHLFCWPCIYKWLHYNQPCQPEGCRCPVCKAEVSHASLIPLYTRFFSTTPSETKPSHLGPAIPCRPRPRACETELFTAPQTHDDYTASTMLGSSSITTNNIHPVIKMMFARTLGSTNANVYTYPNSYGHVSNSSARLRRHLRQADESLNKICFFLFCCLVACFLLF